MGMSEIHLCPICEKPITKEQKQLTLVKPNGKSEPLAHTNCWGLFMHPEEDVKNWKIRDDI